jgi:predicted small lipoprotein YifL
MFFMPFQTRAAKASAYWLMVSAILLLNACGQPGPLYLPSQKPPIHVEPERQKNETKTKQDENK